eukprot:TRINITY_DN46200_c0_g1_i1.p1 TRINITY_DN46200_c0_g1~~TRINITY_DN46200_c0_g1_i1.p1  ORF type:complete len:110 (+),score=6.59 TRINITY_DN46200_c0_g1_i1:25-330(+)
MEEVTAQSLPFWLVKMKAEGYSIVALEQSASSVLTTSPDFHMPEKSVLLLGEERKGLPGHLFPHVDLCVEIPQVGITRSLNVHVAASLLIHEYSRQHPIVS